VYCKNKVQTLAYIKQWNPTFVLNYRVAYRDTYLANGYCGQFDSRDNDGTWLEVLVCQKIFPLHFKIQMWNCINFVLCPFSLLFLSLKYQHFVLREYVPWMMRFSEQFWSSWLHVVFSNLLMLYYFLSISVNFFVIPAEIQHVARASVLLALLSIRCFVIQEFFCTWLVGLVQVIQINIGRNKVVSFRWQFKTHDRTILMCMTYVHSSLMSFYWRLLISEVGI
jgi:hypothetical protein